MKLDCVQEFELFGRPALKKVKKNPNVKVLDVAREMYPDWYLVKYELGLNNYAIVVFESLEYLWRKLTELKNDGKSELIRFHEIISDGALREAYDIEFPIADSNLDVNLFITNFVKLRNGFLNENSANWSSVPSIDARDLIVFNSSDAKKFSLHILVPNKYDCVFDLATTKAWQTDFQTWLKETEAGIEIDAAALSRQNGGFRTLYSRKIGSDRVMRLHQEGAAKSPREYFVNAANNNGNCSMKRAMYVKGLVAKIALPPAVKEQAECAAANVGEFLRSKYGVAFSVEDAGEFWRLRRSSSSKCLVNDAETHHDNHYVYLDKRGYLWIGCPHCPQKTKARPDAFFVPKRAVPEPETLGAATHWFDGFIDAAEYEDILAAHDVVVDARATGCGKTYSALRYAQANFEKYLVMHHRISLDDDYARAYGLPSYRDAADDGSSGACSVVINSLDKILKERYGKNIQNIEFIVVDEIRSVIRQTEMNEIELDVVSFLDILKHAKAKMVLMDANITDNDIEYIQSLRADSRIAVICDKTRAAEFDIDILETTARFLHDDFTAMLAAHDFSKCGVVVPYNIDITKMNGILDFIGQPYININRETRGETDLSAANLNKYPIIAFSPTISEGVSFDSELFGNRIGYGCFIGSSCGPETASQMVRRFRKVNQYYAAIAAEDKRPRFTDERSYLTYASANVKALNARVTRKYTYNGKAGHSEIGVFKDEFWTLHARNAIEEEIQACSYVDTFTRKCVNNKFKVEYIECGSELADDQSSELKAAKEAAVSKRYSTMADLPNIANDAAYKALKNECKTEFDAIRLEKYRLMKDCLMQNPTADQLLYFGTHPAKTRALCRLRDIFGIKVSRNNNDFELNLAAGDDLVQELALCKYKAIGSVLSGAFIDQRAQILKIKPVMYSGILEVLCALGWNDFFDTTPLNQVDLGAFRQFFGYRKYHEMTILAWKRPSKKQHAELMINDKPHTDALIKYINESILSFIGIEIRRFYGKWRIFCLTAFLDPAGDCCSPENARLCTGRLEGIGAHLKREFFIWDRMDTCLDCGKEYLALDHSKHAKKCGEQKAAAVQYVCGVCGKDFGNHKSHYERHLKSCGVLKEKKTYKCEKCAKEYAQKSNLDRHTKNCEK